MNVVSITAENMSQMRKLLADEFAQFEKPGVLTADEIWGDLRRLERQGYVVLYKGEVKAVVLTRVADDAAKSLVITHATGNERHMWQHLFPVLLDWGKSIGCTRVEAVTRPGWKKILNKFGLKQTHVVLEMEL